MSRDPIGDVVRSGFCTGCGLCQAVVGEHKVTVNLTAAGYLRPRASAPLTAAEADLFGAVCPGRRVSHEPSPTAAPSHPLWGPLRSCQTGHASDERLRRQGSSGAVVSALAAYLLQTRQVDFVAQNAADPADPLGNAVQQSRTVDDVFRAAGSRYGPAAPLARIDEFLATGERFAFVGKPCDVAALRALARRDPRVNRQVPFMLSFMCAGVPSRKGTLAVLGRLGVEEKDVVAFRYRGDGWPGKARADTADGRAFEMDYATSWGQVLNQHLQFRCKICPDGTGEFADVVCADAWYGKDGYPDFAEKDGRSLVLGRTERGVGLIEQAVRDGAIRVETLDVAEIAKMQPYQVTRKRQVLARIVGTRLAVGCAPRYRHLGLLRAALGAKPMELIRNAIGTFRRAGRGAE